jgi:undecaprenyl-phosphate 4-deoxy-4-formamido-L-arabinose transferase
MDLSVVIPVYRSALTLEELVRRLIPVLDGTKLQYEIVLVEDGSADDSWLVVQGIRSRFADRVVAVQLMRNYGQHNALMCGFRHAEGEYIITMDDDLQNPPEEIPKLIEAIITSDLDLVYGTYGSKKHLPWRNLSSWVVNSFYRRIFRSAVTVTSFRVMRRCLVKSILPYTLNFTFIDGLLAWNTARIGEVTVEHLPRTRGRSGYSFGKLALLALNLFTNFSLLPLQFVSVTGFVTAALGLLVALVYVTRYLLHEIAVPGYASTIIAILVLGGVQLLSLGIMGEYLGRLHLNVNRKPQYTERQTLGRETASPALGLPGPSLDDDMGMCDGSPRSRA